MLTEEQRKMINSMKAIGLVNENPKYVNIPEEVPQTEISQLEINDYNLLQSVDQDLFDSLSKTLRNEDELPPIKFVIVADNGVTKAKKEIIGVSLS